MVARLCMKYGLRAFCLLYLLLATVGFADEEIRQVQEELRRRNLISAISTDATAPS